MCAIFRGIAPDELARGPYLGAFVDGHRGPSRAYADVLGSYPYVRLTEVIE